MLYEVITMRVRHGRPLVCLKTATTLDGRIATQTGTGKTASFGLPLLHHLAVENRRITSYNVCYTKLLRCASSSIAEATICSGVMRMPS